jgi:C4-dicarboxylate-specific signal transduction histidine kinase
MQLLNELNLRNLHISNPVYLGISIIACAFLQMTSREYAIEELIREKGGLKFENFEERLGEIGESVTVATLALIAPILLLKQSMDAQKKSEEEAHKHRSNLARVAQLEVMGAMAGGVAHELNQPLNALNNYLGFMMLKLDSKTPNKNELKEFIDKASKQTQRAADIVERLRALIRDDKVVLNKIDLNMVVSEAVNLLQVTSGQMVIFVELKLADNLPMVGGDQL